MTCESAAVAMAAVCCLLWCWNRGMILIWLANADADEKGVGIYEDTQS